MIIDMADVQYQIIKILTPEEVQEISPRKLSFLSFLMSLADKELKWRSQAMEYMNEQSFDDPVVAANFKKYIEKIVDIRVKKYCNFDKTYTATVTAVAGDNSTASIKLMDSDAVIPNVKNKSGESLSIGSQVSVEAINNSLTNIVIKYKK